MIRLRFVGGTDSLSKLIAFQAGICMPFTPVHVEAVSQDSLTWIGQHMNGGMQARPAGYDSAPAALQKFVDIDVHPACEWCFYDFVNSRIGQPYDWKTIADFVDSEINLHTPNTAICSAEMVLALRSGKDPFFLWPLNVPAHHISPRDLFLILSSHIRIDH
jgi:hypothetical protein